MTMTSSLSAALLLALTGACGSVADDDDDPAITDEQPPAGDAADPVPQGTEFRFFTALGDAQRYVDERKAEEERLSANAEAVTA